MARRKSRAKTKSGALAASRASATKQAKAKAKLVRICLEHGVPESELAGIVSKRMIRDVSENRKAEAARAGRDAGRDGPTEAGVKVKWITWRTTPPTGGFGHGVGFYDNEIDGQFESRVAFLDGFDWLHGTSNEAIIHCIQPNAITTARVLDAMKKRVEEIVGRRQLPNQRITRRIFAFANA